MLVFIELFFASRSRGADFASIFYFDAGAFVALVGIYPSGTRPRVFASTRFYAQSSLASVAVGTALLAGRWRKLSVVLLLPGLSLVLLGYLAELTVNWPSVA
ncbi:MAG: hypothetical protein QW407_01520 [Thermofilaceae archaeon]